MSKGKMARFILSESADSIITECNTRKKMQNTLPQYSFDKVIFEQGEIWYNNGYTLEEAPEKVRNNSNFINGFNRAKRLKNDEACFYNLGVKLYNDGISWEVAQARYGENPVVLRGYEDSMMNRKKR